MDIEAEFGLPLASITRIVKSRLPEGVQVGKEAKPAFSKASGIFVLYLVSCALDICKESKRSTISAADIFAALEEVEFDEYKDPLRDYLISIESSKMQGKHRKSNKMAENIANSASLGEHGMIAHRCLLQRDICKWIRLLK